MRVFLVANPKGGSGKTTLSTNLAGYLAGAGQRVMLGDIDRQQSAREWLRLRPLGVSRIASWDIQPGEVARPPRDTSHVVLDSPAGLHGKKLEYVLRLADRVIVPLQPSLFDILATRAFLATLMEQKRVRDHRAVIAVVGMRVDPRTRAAHELERFLAESGLTVLTCLRDTQFYVQLAAHGLTLFDLPAARTERDIEQWRPIIDWIEAPDPV